ncbi:amidohydrolase family protein [Frankia sp. CiP3]|uniref:N-acyl-D-amino-acid deacylase family protein n=1 Tax=Frankia sp. CiP3 TaxID=2880971 RepID=UPI001EF42664|nr:amidohydrolase family protein [Frankia sp. CiP3]
MDNLLVRGGSVVDGTGSPARPSDVRVRDGVIAEIGVGLRPDGERVIDASGAYVTPGFIDVHTHFDPTLFWDPMCDPMPQHGVTTALVGNCSLSLAPVRPADRAGLAALFCYIEDLPREVLDTALPWDWESYGDYLDAAGKRGGYGLNVAGLVGHNMLRQYVMGEQAWDRAATADERALIAALLAGSLDAGAFGMSTSLGFDEDRAGRPVPSRIADDAEFAALIDVLADRSRFMTFIPGQSGRQMRADVRRMGDLCRPRDLMHSWIGIFHTSDKPNWAREMLTFAAELQAGGIRSYPQVSPRTLDIHVNWNGGMSWMGLQETWHRMVQATPGDKQRMLTDPQWRAQARAEWDQVPRTMIPHRHPDRIRFVSVTRPHNEKWVGSTLADLVIAHAGHPSDVLADWLLDNDLTPGVVGVGVSNADADGVAETLSHPASIIANSDAGAHLAMMCAIGDTTLTLTRHVRDRDDLTLEQAVHKMTGQLAGLFGFADRGVLREGAAGDVVVFALNELEWKRDVFVSDLPTGAARLRRPAGGYRMTAVAGTIVQEFGELTGARPGCFLRAAR